jgi:hypothetical protein
VLRAALSRIPEFGTKTRVHDGEDERRGLRRAQPNTLRCVTCATDIALASQVVSKGFTGRHGRAYLVSPPPALTPYTLSTKNPQKKNTDLINTKVGKNVKRDLLTGQHVVADVSCFICGTVLGWKYVDAKELAQRYKIGKFILEMKRVVLGVGWEDAGVGSGEDGNVEFEEEEVMGKDEGEEEGVIVFDSEDEDECEDLFAGVWDPEVVAKRRGMRVVTRKRES